MFHEITVREALKKKEEEQKTLNLDEIEETTVSPAVAAMARAAVSSAWELKQMLGNMSKLTTNATSILNCIRGTPQPDWYVTTNSFEVLKSSALSFVVVFPVLIDILSFSLSLSLSLSLSFSLLLSVHHDS